MMTSPWRNLGAAALAAALLLGFAVPVQAEGQFEFLGNLDATRDDDREIGGTRKHILYQGFTTGDDDRYLRSVVIRLAREPEDGTISAKLCDAQSNGYPHRASCDNAGRAFDEELIEGDWSGGSDAYADYTFGSPGDIAVGSNTKYFIEIEFIPGDNLTTPEWWYHNSSQPSETDLGWQLDEDNYAWYRDDNDVWRWEKHDNAQYLVSLRGIPRPTSADKTVNFSEDGAHTFAVADFPYSHAENDPLDHVKISTLPEQGTLTLNDIDVERNQAVSSGDIRNLKYTPNANFNGSDSFKFKVNDGEYYSAEYTFTFNVASVNDRPTVADSSVTTNEDTAYTFALGDFGYSDVEDSLLSHLRITSLPLPSGGTLEFQGATIEDSDLNPYQTVTRGELVNGDLRYRPPLNGNGADFASFNFKAKDGSLDSEDSAVMTIAVLAVNDAPVAVDDAVTMTANTVEVISVLTNDADVDEDPLSVTAVGSASVGTATITDDGTTVTYHPPDNSVGTVTFDYTVSDGTDTDTSTDTGVVTVTVIPAVLGPSFPSYAENGTGAVATYSPTGNPAWSLSGDDSGAFTIDDDGDLRFNSSPDYETPTDDGGDNTYKLTLATTVVVDSVSYTGTRDVEVTVTDVDEPLVWSEQTEFSFPENTVADRDQGIGAAATVTVSDPERVRVTGWSSAIAADDHWFGYNADVADDGAGFRIFFKDPPDFESANDEDGDNGYETGVTIRLGNDPVLQSRYVTIRVTDVNDAPVAGDDDASTREDTSIEMRVLDNDSDQDAATTLSVAAVGTPDGVDTATEINPASGTVAITDNGTTVTYTPAADFHGDDTFTYQVSDNHQESDGTDAALTAVGTVTVTVNPVNDRPVAVDDTVTIDEGATGAQIDVITGTGTGSDSDVDGDTLSVSAVGSASHGATAITAGSTTSVTYTPDAGFAGIDRFTYTVSDGTATDNSTDTGTVTVKVTPAVSGEPEDPSYAENGTGSVATYTANGSPTWSVSGTDGGYFSIDASGVLTFETSPDYETPADANGDNSYELTVEATIEDGEVWVTGELEVTVTVTEANDAPVAVADEAKTAEGTAVDVAVVANDSDDDVGDTLSVSAVGSAGHGAAVITAGSTTSVTYTPDAGFAGIDRFTYTVSDGTATDNSTDTGTVTVGVVPTVSGEPEDPSYAENGTGAVATYTANGSPTWSLSGTDGDEFSIDAGGVLRFDSSPDFEVPTGGGNGNSNTYELKVVATITDGDDSEKGALDVTVTVTEANDAPVAVADDAETDEDTAVTIAVLTNDSDQDANTTLSVSAVGNAGDGAAVITAGSTTSVTYTPDAGFAGIDRFTYTVSDSTATDIGTVTVKVVPTVSGEREPNYAENGTGPVATYTANGSPTWSVSGTDADEFSIDASGVLRFASSPDFEVPTGGGNGDSNTYELKVVATITDGGVSVTGERVVTVTVTAANDAPVAVADEAETGEGTAVDIAVVANDTDADDDTLSVSAVGNASHGATAITAGSTTSVTYTPDAGFAGIDRFTYTVSDSTATDIGTVTVGVVPTVSGEREPNYAENGTGPVATYTANGSPTWSVSGTDADEFSIDASGVLRFASSPDFEVPTGGGNGNSNTYQLKVVATIADGGVSVTGERVVTVTVTAANDAPVAVADEAETDEDTAVTIAVLTNDSDDDVGDTLSVSAVGNAGHGATVITAGSTTSVTYTPDAGFAGIDRFTYTVSDSTATDIGTVTVKVVPTVSGERAPNYAENGTGPVATYTANGSPTWSVSGTDKDAFTIVGGVLRFVSSPDHENPTDVDGDNADADDNIYELTVEATITDGDDQVTGTRDVTVTVTDVNEAPVAVADTATTAEGESVDIAVLANDSGDDGDTLSVSAVGLAGNGTAAKTSGSTTSVTYTPNTGFAGFDSFTYTVSDGTPNTADSTGTVTVGVVPTVSGLENPMYAENGTGTVATYSANGSPTWSLSGTDGDAFTIDDDGDLRFESSPDYETPADANSYELTVEAKITDGDDQVTGTLAVIVTVTEANDAPVAAADDAETAEGTAVTIAVVANDSDDDGDTLSVSAVGNADDGTTAIPSGSTTTVTYTPDAGFAGFDSFDYSVSDGQTTATGTVTVGVVPTVSGLENPMYAENGTGTVATYSANGTPAWGLAGDDAEDFSIDASSGVLTFASPPDYETPTDANRNNIYDLRVVATITADATDPTSATVTGTRAVTVQVTDVNEAPVAAADTATTAEEVLVTIRVLANDSDDDGDTLTVSAVEDASIGTTAIPSGSTTTVTYTPATGFAGFDSFDYTVSDGQTTATGTVTVGVVPDVGGPEAPSYAENGTGTVATYSANGSPAWSLLSGDDADAFSIDASSGVLTFASSPDYEAPADANGDNSYELTVVAKIAVDANDPTSATVAGTRDVTVAVTDVNEAPVALDDTATTAEGASVEIRVLANDTDPEQDPLTVSAVGNARHGATAIPSGSTTTVTYTPDADFAGFDSFDYTVSDGQTTATGTVTVGVVPTVSGLENPMYAEKGTGTVATYSANGTPAWSLLLGNDADDFSIDANSGELTFASPPDYETPADSNGDNIYELTVQATITDGDDQVTGTLAVAVEVTDVDEAPVALDDTATTAEGESVDIAVLVNDTDPDQDTLTVSAVGRADNGTAAKTSGSTTTVTYTPDANFAGFDSFDYTVSDGQTTATGTVTVGVVPDVSGPEEPSYAENDTGTVATYSANGSPAWSLLSGDDADAFNISTGGVLTFKVPPDYETPADANGDNSYELTVVAKIAADANDPTSATVTGTRAVTVEVTDVNEAPVAAADEAETDEGTEVTIRVLANDTDPEQDPLTVSAVGDADIGTTAIPSGSTTTVTYTPATDFAGFAGFDYTVSDGQTTATGTVTVGVVPDVGGPEEPSYAENRTGTVATYSANGSPAWSLWSGDDADAFSIDASSGVLTFASSPDYEAPADANGDNSYELTVVAKIAADATDPNSATVTGTRAVTVAVTDVNEAPVALDDTATTAEGASVEIRVLANDTDPDQDPLTVSAVGDASIGTTAIASGSTTVNYTPGIDAANNNFVGIDSFDYTVSDGQTTATGTVTVTVGPAVSGEPESPSYAENGTGAVATYTAKGNPAWSLSGTDKDDFTIRADGVLEFNEPPDYEDPGRGTTYQLTVEATIMAGDDEVTGTLAVAVEVTDIEEAPVAIDDTVTTGEEVAVVISVLSNDKDQDANTTLSVTAVGTPDGVDTAFEINPANGSVVITAGSTTSVTYTPDLNFDGTDTFTYTVSDGALTDIGMVTVSVSPVNYPPTGKNNKVTVDENTTFAFTASDFSFHDPDRGDLDTLGLKITSLPAPDKGTLSLEGRPLTDADVGDVVPQTQLAQLSALEYTPPAKANGRRYAEFTFKVNDGEVDSVDEYTIFIHVRDVLDNAALAGLTIAVMNESKKETFTKEFVIDEEVRDYSVKVANDMSTSMVTAATVDGGATVTVNGEPVSSGSSSAVISLAEGGTTKITIQVVSQDRMITTPYTLMVSRAASSIAALETLTISSCPLDPVFAAEHTDYTCNVDQVVDSVGVTPTAAHFGATVTVNGAAVTSGDASDVVLVRAGPTTITVVVTAQDENTTRTYTVAAVPPWPWVTGSLPPLILYAGGAAERVDAASVVTGKDLRWSFVSSDSKVAAVQGEGSVVVVTPVREGTAEVTVTAQNDYGMVSLSFAVSVRTSAAEQEAIRAVLAGQGRVVLGSVTEVIGDRLAGRFGGGAGSAGSGCGDAAGGGGGARSDHAAGDGVRSVASGEGRGVVSGDIAGLVPVLAGRSFSLALDGAAADCADADGSAGGRWNLWGAADLQRASGGTEVSEFEGEWRFLYLGLDYAFHPRWRGGAAVSGIWGDAEYRFADVIASGGGRLTSTLVSVYPYVQGRLTSGMEVWAIGGFGLGDIENERTHVPGHPDAGGLSMGLAAAGLRRPLTPAGGAELALTSDAGFVSLSVDGNGSLEGAEASASRVRLGLEMAYRFGFGLEPFARLYGRYDGGDGPSGAAGEVIAGLRYVGERLNLAVRGNYLVSLADFQQWGVNAQVGWAPHADGSGLTGSLTTQWGAAESGGGFLHGHTMQMPSAAVGAAGGGLPAPEVSGEIGYGLSIPQLAGRLTPHLGYDYRGPAAARARVGVAYALQDDAQRDLRLSLDVTRSEHPETAPDHRLELRAGLGF